MKGNIKSDHWISQTFPKWVFHILSILIVIAIIIVLVKLALGHPMKFLGIELNQEKNTFVIQDSVIKKGENTIRSFPVIAKQNI